MSPIVIKVNSSCYRYNVDRRGNVLDLGELTRDPNVEVAVTDRMQWRH